MKIIYYNNCWFTNVGEAFIDIGAKEKINQIWNKPQIASLSDMSDFFYAGMEPHTKETCNQVQSATLYKYLNADYFVLAGMFASETYLASPGRKMVDYLANHGVRIGFLGLGSEKYTENEHRKFASYLEHLKPSFVETRDEYTYHAYKDYAKCILGLDCAYWVRDGYNPMGFGERNYDVITFNRSSEPIIDNEYKSDVVRPWHMQYFARKTNLKENYLISDNPFDYLTVYANANKVYTDLVHATIPALVYETPVKYWYIDRRSEAFKMVEGLNIDNNGFMTVDNIILQIQKKKIIKEITETINF